MNKSQQAGDQTRKSLDYTWHMEIERTVSRWTLASWSLIDSQRKVRITSQP